MKQPVKTIVVKSDGVYVSHLEKPIEPKPEWSGDKHNYDGYVYGHQLAVKAYEQAINAYASSLIKVENPEVLADFLVVKKFGEDSMRPEGTYPAPDGLCMEVKKCDGFSCGEDCKGKNEFEYCDLALCSFLPDKEEEKPKATFERFETFDLLKAGRTIATDNTLELKEDVGEEKGDDELITAIKEHLAVMHRDGGHYTEANGLLKSIKDATENYWELRTLADNSLSPQEKPVKEEGWISVKDRLPENKNTVLTLDSYDGIMTAYYNHKDKTWYTGEGTEWEEVEGWLPLTVLPNPPKA